MRQGVFLTYCTNALLAQRELPTLQIVAVGPELNVGAEYGLVVLKNAPESAYALVQFILAEKAQAVLVRYGFGRGDPIT